MANLPESSRDFNIVIIPMSLNNHKVILRRSGLRNVSEPSIVKLWMVKLEVLSSLIGNLDVIYNLLCSEMFLFYCPNYYNLKHLECQIKTTFTKYSLNSRFSRTGFLARFCEFAYSIRLFL